MSKLSDSNDEDNNGLDSSLPAVRTICVFKEGLEKLQRLYSEGARRPQKQMELSQTTEEMQLTQNLHLHQLDSRVNITLEFEQDVQLQN